MEPRIVITAAGVISPIGAGLDDFEKGLYSGASGVGPSPLLGNGAAAAAVREFTPQQWLGNKGIRVLDRTARLLCVAAQMALRAAGRSGGDATAADPACGLVCGTMFGSIHSITSFDWSGLEDGPNLVNPMDFPNTVINSAAGQAAIKFKLGGVNSTICGAQASGLYALDYAAGFLRLGRARMLLGGGAEELSEEAWRGFQKNDLLSASDTPRPFHPSRDGVVLGEGAALLVLESAETALERGARPWAEIAGFGCAQDANSISAFAPRAEGATAAIQAALESAGIGNDQIACIIASASGSRPADEMESCALENIFGARLPDVPVCAPKAALGELLGAAGAVGALIAALALQKQRLAPTAGADDSHAYGVRLSGQAQTLHGDYALVNAFSCDGNNAALVLRRSRASGDERMVSG
jgi:3-oxoacyl-[acyl-carrier-protein] synthase II